MIQRERRVAKLLLTGSSIMELWSEPETLAPDWRVVNRAVGGTTVSYWVEHLAGVLADERPEAVLAYVGSNDIGSGAVAETVIGGVRQCLEIVRAYSPSLPFGYLAIIKAPARLSRFDDIASANAGIRALLSPSDLWLESDPVFLSGGKPVARFFADDDLHLNADAYKALTASIRPGLGAWLARLSGTAT